MNNSLKDMKNIYGTYFLLIAIIMFVVVYFIINYSNLTSDNLFSGDYVKPILITGILLLLCNLFLSDEEEEEFDSLNSKIYKIRNDEEKLEELEKLGEIEEIKYENNNRREGPKAYGLPSKMALQSNTAQPFGPLFKMMNDKDNKNNKNLIKNDYIRQKTNSPSTPKEINRKKNRNVFLPYKDNTMKFALKT